MRRRADLSVKNVLKKMTCGIRSITTLDGAGEAERASGEARYFQYRLVAGELEASDGQASAEIR